MEDNPNVWKEYGELLLKELERLNKQYEGLREDFGTKFEGLDEKLNQMNLDIHSVKGMESKVNFLAEWKEKVDDVMSPTQMKEMKDELYNQKGKWTSAIAILAFINFVLGTLVILAKLGIF